MRKRAAERNMNETLGDMEFRLLKLATRKLLDHFGSLKAAAELCRVKPTNLSQYQSFEHTTFMPVDVILTLERAAGRTFLSDELKRLSETATSDDQDREVRDEALDILAVGELLAFVCEATAEHSESGIRLSENEKRRYFELRRRVGQELDELDSAVEQDGTLHRHKA